MGAKAPEKLAINRSRRLQCHICHRSFQTIQGLRSHQICVHKIKKVNLRARLRKGKTEIKLRRQLMLKNKMPVESTSSNNMPDDKVIHPKPKICDIRKIEFGCPKCSKVFPVYFSAYRHIQKNHCVNSRGEKVPPNSASLIKPIRHELCAKCNKKIHSAEGHACASENLDEVGSKTVYTCLGCNNNYSSMHLFDLHLSTLHSTCVESMFLPTYNEFMNWKQHMEMQTKTKYQILGNSNIKQIYRCTYESTDEKSDTVHLCPSSIVLQEFSKGIQVHYYKQHYGHSCNEYKLLDKFKKFSITNLMKNAELYMDITDVKSDEDDLYLQFKKLMTCIVFDAAKINITTLKILHGKALEMTSILNNYDEDEDQLNNITPHESTLVLTNKSTGKITDDQITNELEGSRSSLRIKRRINETLVPKDEKKIKLEIQDSLVNDENEKERPIEDEELQSKLKEEETCELLTPKTEYEPKNNGSPKVVAKLKPMIQSPSSFNDSYKNFVDTTFNLVSSKTSTPLRRTRNSTMKDTKKKVIVKTKMGQFVPNSSPKKEHVLNKVKEIVNNNIKESLKTDVRPKPNILKNRLTSKSSNIIKTNTTDKHVLKFKSRIERPNQRVSSKVTVKKSYISKHKMPDIKYEVKEQENDCNILILKI